MPSDTEHNHLIADSLSLYPDECRYITSFTYNSNILVAQLRHFRYPFTVNDLDYVTATQISLYLSQLAYLFFSISLTDDSSPIQHAISQERLTKQAQAGRLFFVDMKQRMRPPMLKSDALYANLSLHRVRTIRTKPFAMINYAFNDDA